MKLGWPWLALVGLGAFHGINPAMGWLFAVALGLQRHSRAAVLRSLVPIAIGHAISVAFVVAAIALLHRFVDITALQVGAAITLIAFGLYRSFARHRARVGMCVTDRDLLTWSFLMATAHGAGLMLLPVLLETSIATTHSEHASHMAIAGELDNSVTTAIAVVVIHTTAMLVVAGVIAIAVYEWLGLAFLRRGWINLDLLWVLVLIGAGLILLVGALTAASN